MSSLPKPELRGHLSRFIRRAIIGAFGFGCFNCGLWYLFYMRPIKMKYAEYYRTYDAQKEYAEMSKYGYLRSS